MASEFSAQEIASALGARRYRDGWIARCPAHHDKTPSFSIGTGSDGKVLVCCFAGCEQDHVLSALRRRGLWGEAHEKRAHRPKPTTPPINGKGDHEQDAARIRAAKAIFEKAQPIRGTAGETYFRSRSIMGPLPDCLRFTPALKRVQDNVTDHPPCIVAPFTDIRTNVLRAIHRTWLKPDGSGKADGMSRMWLGKASECAIKLTPDEDVTMGLSIAEGVETALCVCEVGLPCWSLGSASNMAKFPVLSGIESLCIFADHDANGIGLNAARECAARWNAAGVEVRIVLPKQQGHDFNDALNVARARHG